MGCSDLTPVCRPYHEKIKIKSKIVKKQKQLAAKSEINKSGRFRARNSGEGIDIMESRSTGKLEVRDAIFLTLHNLESGVLYSWLWSGKQEMT